MLKIAHVFIKVRNEAIMTRYKYLLLDADGTLFNYDKAEATALKAALLQTGLPVNDASLQAYRKINTQIWLDYEQGLLDKETLKVKRFERLFNVIGQQADALSFSEQYTLQLSRQADLFPGALDFLKAISTRYHLSIVTNGIAHVQYPRLEKSNILPMISAVFVSEEVGYQKPDAAFYDYIFKTLDIKDISQTLMIGDSLTADIKGGINAEIDTCWFNPEKKSGIPEICPTYEVDNYQSLLQILQDKV